MKIVIAGVGEVGLHLAKMLGDEFHDITVIDSDMKKLENAMSNGDVFTIKGDMTTFETLEKAELKTCNLFIAVSSIESRNILSAMLAKRMGAKKVIARIDNDEYLQPDNKEVFLNMGIDYLFYPEKSAANEVITLLNNTNSSEYMTFSDNKLTLVVMTLDSYSPLIDMSLLQASQNTKTLHYRTVAISRNGETIIPHKEEIFKEGDTIYVIASRRYADDVLSFSGKDKIQVKNLMILGGSKIGQRIALAMQESLKVKLVDYSLEKANLLSERLKDTLVIYADGRNKELMMEEQLGEMDAFVAVTGRSETNILAAMLAKKLGVKKVIAEVENINYINLAASMGVDTVINKKLTTASNIFRFTMNTDVQAIKCLNGCDAEVLELIAKPGSIITKHKLRELKFPVNATIGGIVRGDKVIIANGDTDIKAYDRVVVFSLPDAILKIGRYFD
ncbi:MAG: Trk system potassium transporter TrkA [Rikenellaceae bacterium]